MSKQLKYREVVVGGQKGLIIDEYTLPTNHLSERQAGQLVLATKVDLLIFIPPGYKTTKLDSFHTIPRLQRADGTDPQQASGSVNFDSRTWQFWSRHLGDADWNAGIDGLDVFMLHIRKALQTA